MQLDQILRLAAFTVERVIQPFSAAGRDVADHKADVETEGGGLDAGCHTAGARPGFGSILRFRIAAQQGCIGLGAADTKLDFAAKACALIQSGTPRRDVWLVGTFGDVGTLSFYPAHHITMGEGGAVFTNNGKLKLILESVRDWGRDCFCDPGKDNTCGKRFCWKLGGLPEGYDHKYVYSHLGYNLKISDMQAACGLAQMDKLPGFVEARRRNFEFLHNAFAPLEDFLVLPSATPGEAPKPDTAPPGPSSAARSQPATLSDVMPQSMTVNGSVTTSGAVGRSLRPARSWPWARVPRRAPPPRAS